MEFFNHPSKGSDRFKEFENLGLSIEEVCRKIQSMVHKRSLNEIESHSDESMNWFAIDGRSILSAEELAIMESMFKSAKWNIRILRLDEEPYAPWPKDWVAWNP